MKNLKIRVANKAESKEAQELLDILGYSKGAFENKSTPCWIAICDGLTYSDYNIGKNIWYTACPKEITLQELRDMVNPMKEYLEKQADGSYKLVMRGVVGKDDDIEVPEGAEVAVYPHFSKGISFFKNNFRFAYADSSGEWKETDYCPENLKHWKSWRVAWQRHTQPEELPFMDSLNDQYAEIEQVRKQTIEATLAERQAQYGCFEDVAFVTENIMAVLSKVRTNGLNDLPYPHRMALYMIASKMARIVNGDFNSIDGWHDIGGYSKLIEDLL